MHAGRLGLHHEQQLRGTLYVGVTSDLGQRISIFDVSSLSKLSPKYPVLSI
jgi:predicted GIY-YIG superfamily endonuclease